MAKHYMPAGGFRLRLTDEARIEQRFTAESFEEFTAAYEKADAELRTRWVHLKHTHTTDMTSERMEHRATELKHTTAGWVYSWHWRREHGFALHVAWHRWGSDLWIGLEQYLEEIVRRRRREDADGRPSHRITLEDLWEAVQMAWRHSKDIELFMGIAGDVITTALDEESGAVARSTTDAGDRPATNSEPESVSARGMTPSELN